MVLIFFFFFLQAEDGIRDLTVTGVQTCALPISPRQTAPAADADDVFPAARRRFCRPLRAAEYALAPGRLSRTRRPLHLHGLRARCLTRLPSALAAQSLSLRAYSGYHVLLSRPAGHRGAPHPERAPETEILRSGHGLGIVVRPRRKFPLVPGAHP